MGEGTEVMDGEWADGGGLTGENAHISFPLAWTSLRTAFPLPAVLQPSPGSFLLLGQYTRPPDRLSGILVSG